VVLLVLRKTGSPAGTDAGNITHYWNARAFQG